MDNRITAILCALLAAVFYAVNTPVSKLLLIRIQPTFMAALLYLGAGIGVGLMSLLNKKRERAEKLSKKDLPYTVGMILLDIAAPILLMTGIQIGSSSNASLLGNFEIVATTLIALYIFRETVSGQLWIAILLIALSSAILSFEGAGSLQFSVGSLFVIGATLCWGLENNCTRKISGKSAYEIVILKGLFSGGGSLAIAFLTGESFPQFSDALCALALGFVSYGLSIFLYIRAQRTIGAAKTSAYYAVAPFVGVILSFAFLGETLTRRFLFALCVMLIGTVFVILDTLRQRHTHSHTHTFSHIYNGTARNDTIVHTHPHNHYTRGGIHRHYHSVEELEAEFLSQH